MRAAAAAFRAPRPPARRSAPFGSLGGAAGVIRLRGLTPLMINRLTGLKRRSAFGHRADNTEFAFHSSMIATARVQPAEARSIFAGKQETVNPAEGSASRLCSFSIWQ